MSSRLAKKLNEAKARKVKELEERLGEEGASTFLEQEKERIRAHDAETQAKYFETQREYERQQELKQTVSLNEQIAGDRKMAEQLLDENIALRSIATNK